MEKMLQESVATLFCHAMKLDNKDIEIERPIFCRFMSENFDCDSEDAEELLDRVLEKDSDNIDTHISIISNGLYNEPYTKMSILRELNHIIFRSNMKSEDYEFFDKVKKSFFL